jgi:hypothetical protein
MLARPLPKKGIEMIEAIKLVGSIVGLLTGIAVFYDRMARGRPIASLTTTTRGAQNGCIRISNVSDYDIAIIDATVKPAIYFLTEDMEAKTLLEGAFGHRPYFMLRPREEKEFVIALVVKDGKAIEEPVGDACVVFRISWRRGNATWIPQVPVWVWADTSTILRYQALPRPLDF